MIDRRDGDGELDDFTLRRVLRAEYAAPAGTGYWEALEASILEHVRGGGLAAPPRVHELLAGWSRAGLLAAGLAGLIAGLAVSRARQAEARVAFEAVFRDSSPVVALQTAHSAEAPVLREATLRYLINP